VKGKGSGDKTGGMNCPEKTRGHPMRVKRKFYDESLTRESPGGKKVSLQKIKRNTGPKPGWAREVSTIGKATSEKERDKQIEKKAC